MATPSARASGAAGGARLLVPDVLRGLAIVAMLVAHAVPFLPGAPGLLRDVMAQVNDVASPLFALVMGMAAQLVTSRTPRSGWGRLLFQQLVRGAVLVALGLWMAGWGSWVAIVLGHLGVLLVVGTPLVLLPTRWLAAVAAGVALLAAPLNARARDALLGTVDLDSPGGQLLGWLVLGGQYRVTNLLPFFLVGALLLRHGFRRDRLLWGLVALAPVAYLVLPVLLRVRPGTDVSSGSLPDTLHDVGLVLAVYTGVVLMTGLRGPRVRRVVDAVTAPLALVGTVALSLYVLHVGVIALWAPDGRRPVENDEPGWLVVLLGTLLVGWAWARLVGTGPVEWVLGLVTGRRLPRRRRA